MDSLRVGTLPHRSALQIVTCFRNELLFIPEGQAFGWMVSPLRIETQATFHVWSLPHWAQERCWWGFETPWAPFYFFWRMAVLGPAVARTPARAT